MMDANTTRRTRVMLWELWRASRWELLMRVAGLASFMLLIYALSRHMDSFQYAIIRGLAVIMIGAVCVFSSSWTGDLDNQSRGFTFRLGFARPISNTQLVAVPWIYSVVCAVLIYNLAALAYYGLLGQSLPIILPSLTLACVVALFISVVWISETGLEKIFGLFGATLLFIVIFWQRSPVRAGNAPVLIALGDANMLDVRWFDWLASIALCGVCLSATIVAVSRQRRGEHWGWSRWIGTAEAWLKSAGWIDAFQQIVARRLSPPSSYGLIRVQWWFEIRRSIHLVVVATLMSFAALAFIGLVPLVNPDWGGATALRLWLIAMAGVPFITLIACVDKLAGLQARQGAVTLSKFEATRPLRCDQMMAIKLLTCASWTTLSLMMVVTLAACYSAITGDWPHWQILFNDASQALEKLLAHATYDLQANSGAANTRKLSWIHFASVAVSFALACAASSAALMTFTYWMPRHKGIFLAINLLALAHVGLFALDKGVLKGALEPIWRGYGVLIPAIIVVFCLAIMRRALVSRLVGRRYLATVAVMWLACVTSALYNLNWISSEWQIDKLPLLAWFTIIAALVIPPTAALAAPLSLAAYRHQ